MKITKILINKMPVNIKYNVLTCNSSLHSLDHICSSMRKQLRQISCHWTVTNSHSYQRKLDHASLLCCDNKLYFAASLMETPKCTRCITLAMSPVEVFVTARFLISDCSFLKHLTIWFSVLQVQIAVVCTVFLIRWFLQFRGQLDPLIDCQGLWLFDSFLIPVTNASTGDWHKWLSRDVL